MITVDASAWVRALVDQAEHGAAARSILAANPRWFAPAHTPLEALRTLRRYEAAEVLDGETTEQLTREIIHASVRYFGPDRWILRASWLLRHNVSSYDAPYVVIAQAFDIPLVTFDTRLAVAADKLGVQVIFPGA